MNRLQRLKEAALLLPLAGFLLLVPPLLSIFGGRAQVFGLPLLPAYIFTLWLLLIGGGWLLARRLSAAEGAGSRDGPRPESGEEDG